VRRLIILVAFAAAAVTGCGSSATSSSPAASAPGAASPTIAAAGVTPAPPTTGAATTTAPATAVASPASTTDASTTGGSPASPVACSLLTAAEASAALGVPVNAGAPAVDPRENVCSFGGKAIADMVKFVEVEVVDPVEFTPTRASVAGQFEIIPATGVGDAAYYQKDILPNNSGTRWSLSVQKGATVIRLDIVHPGASDAQVKAAEMRLATAALARF
jgi:hypothetical protein